MHKPTHWMIYAVMCIELNLHQIASSNREALVMYHPQGPVRYGGEHCFLDGPEKGSRVG